METLKVVGWTYTKNHFRVRGDIEAMNAVIEEVRKNGYKFAGDIVEYRNSCTPILSDGSKFITSTREWGYIMAKAHNIKASEGGFNHMAYYMDEYAPKEKNYPKEFIDFSVIKNDRFYKLYLDNESIDRIKNFELDKIILPLNSCFLSERIEIYNLKGEFYKSFTPTFAYRFDDLSDISEDEINETQFKGMDIENIIERIKNYDGFKELEDGFVMFDSIELWSK